MKWTKTKSDKNPTSKPIIIFPYGANSNGELHDNNDGWIKKITNRHFSLL